MMEIHEITEPLFSEYGKSIDGLDFTSLFRGMESIPYREGVAYEASIPSLEEDPESFRRLRDSVYGGMPIQIGMCWGHNTRLNCLEYHRDSEIDIGLEPFILLLAKQTEMKDFTLDTSKVVAFRVPAGTAVEVYATTLHYAPCSAQKGKGFKVAVVLPKGTNEEKPSFDILTAEDRLMRARNKWLLAHAESTEAQEGAAVALTGPNIDIQNLIH